MFGDLQIGYQVHMLSCFDNEMPKYSTGKVVAKSDPRFLPPTDPACQYGRVMDITVESGSGNNTYTVPENQNVAKAMGITLSMTIDPILNELESMKKASKSVIDSERFHKERLSVCDRILEDVNPAFRQAKEQDRKIAGIEGKVSELSSSFEDLKKLIIERLK